MIKILTSVNCSRAHLAKLYDITARHVRNQCTQGFSATLCITIGVRLLTLIVLGINIIVVDFLDLRSIARPRNYRQTAQIWIHLCGFASRVIDRIYIYPDGKPKYLEYLAFMLFTTPEVHRAKVCAVWRKGGRPAQLARQKAIYITGV